MNRVHILLTLIIILLISLFTRRERRLHVYGVGIFKSGTSSLSCMFQRYRSVHQHDKLRLFNLIVDGGDDNIVNYLKERDEDNMFDVDTSGYNVFIIDHLVNTFPDAKFILTIRDPVDHFDSIINHINVFEDDHPSVS